MATALNEHKEALEYVRGVPQCQLHITAKLISESMKAAVAGASYVTYTYGVYILFKKMPTIDDLSVRAKLGEDTITGMKKKVSIPSEFKTFAKALGEGKDPYEAVLAEKLPA